MVLEAGEEVYLGVGKLQNLVNWY